MVWMMSLPEGFGEFWPDGDFEDGDNSDAVGWTGRLKAHIKNLPAEQRIELMPSGDWFDYGYFVSTKFITEVGEKAAVDLPPVTPVLEHEAPRTFHTKKTYKELGDLLMLNDRILAVSADLKAIIENMEPGNHQFFPIDIIQPRSAYPRQFFTIVITNHRNSFRDPSGLMSRWSDGRFQFSNVNKKEAAQCCFESREFAGAHLWYERLLNANLVLFSVKLAAHIQDAGLRTPKIYQARAV